jgi:multidrug efflux system outer membrane protein
MKAFKLKLLGLASSILLNSCQVGPSYFPPAVDAPSSWKNPYFQGELPREDCGDWWKAFKDETLNELESYAINNNYQFKMAKERVEQAWALACMTKSALYPKLDLDAGYLNRGVLSRLYAPPGVSLATPFMRQHQRTNSLLFNLSYELDLWGYNLSQYQASAYSAQAEEERFLSVMLTLTSEVADSYFRARVYDSQIDLYLKTIETRKKAYQINKDRYADNIIDYSAVSRAELDLTNVEAAYYEAMRLRSLEEDRLAVLLGINPSDFCLAHSPLVLAPPIIPADIPSDVLLQRPDIHQAERNLAANNANVKTAYADFFPKLNLTGALGYSSPDLNHFLSWASRLWALGADAFQTVFDGWYKECQLKRSWAQYFEADAAYRQQVLIAFQEVEDSLTNIEYLEKEYQKIGLSVQAAEITYRIAYDRYLQGLTFYLEVTDSERDLLNAERNLRMLLGLRYSATIQLIRAMGGSF